MTPTDADVLLVGGGVASVRCARTLRREGFTGSIVLVAGEAVAPYNRPPLSKELLRGDVPGELVAAEAEGWYGRRGVELVLGSSVTQLDLAAQTALTGDGRSFRFERCLLATGAEPRRVGVRGDAHAHVLRTLEDARAIRRAAVAGGTSAPAVVIGGGLIGIEVAGSLAALGLRPTVVERAPELWSGRLGSTLAAWASRRLEAAGIAIRSGETVTALEAGAVVTDADRLPSAVTVAGVGVIPRDEVAAAAGLEVDDGIVAGDDHRTSHPAVWTAGDVARVTGRRVEHWHAAREGGERAARSMLGLPLAEVPAPWTFTEVAGASLDVVGEPGSWDDEHWVVRDRILVQLSGGRVVRVCSIDGALSPEAMRRLVSSAATPEDVAAAAAAAP